MWITSLILVPFLGLMELCHCLPARGLSVEASQSGILDSTIQLQQEMDTMKAEIKELKASMNNDVSYHHSVSKRCKLVCSFFFY